jgi:hypothetical protein
LTGSPCCDCGRDPRLAGAGFIDDAGQRVPRLGLSFVVHVGRGNVSARRTEKVLRRTTIVPGRIRMHQHALSGHVVQYAC